MNGDPPPPAGGHIDVLITWRKQCHLLKCQSLQLRFFCSIPLPVSGFRRTEPGITELPASHLIQLLLALLEVEVKSKGVKKKKVFLILFRVLFCFLKGLPPNSKHCAGSLGTFFVITCEMYVMGDNYIKLSLLWETEYKSIYSK